MNLTEFFKSPKGEDFVDLDVNFGNSSAASEDGRLLDIPAQHLEYLLLIFAALLIVAVLVIGE